MKPTLNIAITAARAAGQIILRNYAHVDQLRPQTKQYNDFVSEVDQMAEQEIIATIRKAYPSHAILAEESGEHSGDEFQWIIDPLDGTTNFLHGFPQFSVSIALKHEKKLEVGVVYDPFKEELFAAERGGGATLNNRRIRVSKRTHLEGALLGTGFPYREGQDLDGYLRTLRKILEQTTGIRRAGSAALDLAYVANGRLDGFWEFDLNAWDIAAGVLLIQEAGGLVSDTQGGHSYLESGDLVCANPKLFKTLLTIVNSALKSAQA